MKKLYISALLVSATIGINAQVYDVGSFAQMTSVSDNGVAVGNVYGVLHVIWTEEAGGSVIGEIQNDYIGGMTTVSRDGTTVTGSMTNPSTGKDEMSKYDVASKTWTYLGGLGNSSGTDTSSAWGASYDAKTIVGLGWTSSGKAHGIKWTEANGMQDLGSTVTGRSSRANSVSGDGNVVIGWQDSSTGGRQGVYWKNGQQNYIKTTAGNHVGEAISVSEDGSVIVGLGLDENAFYWSATDGYTAIAPLDEDYFGSATAVSSDGKTVLGYFTPYGGMALDGYGFIWTKEKGVVKFDDYVASLGYDTLGLKFSLPMAISPNGQYIAGIGLTADDARGFVIKLPDSTMATNDAKKAKLRIYPNPTKDFVNISNEGKISNIEIYNMTGQKMNTISTSSEKKVDVQHFEKGSYILKITNDGKVETLKFIKD